MDILGKLPVVPGEAMLVVLALANIRIWLMLAQDWREKEDIADLLSLLLSAVTAPTMIYITYKYTMTFLFVGQIK